MFRAFGCRAGSPTERAGGPFHQSQTSLRAFSSDGADQQAALPWCWCRIAPRCYGRHAANVSRINRRPHRRRGSVRQPDGKGTGGARAFGDGAGSRQTLDDSNGSSQQRNQRRENSLDRTARLRRKGFGRTQNRNWHWRRNAGVAGSRAEISSGGFQNVFDRRRRERLADFGTTTCGLIMRESSVSLGSPANAGRSRRNRIRCRCRRTG